MRYARQIRYEIPEEMWGHKISEFLHGKGFSNQNLTKLKKINHSIDINGRWEYMGYRLQKGDVLQVLIVEEESSKKIPPVKLPLEVVYEDEDILVVNKPAHMPIHPSMKHYENTLGNAVAYYFMEQNKPCIYRCINRLDKDTSGLTILAKHFVAASMLYDQMVAREIKRTYYAITDGEVPEEEGTINAPIGREGDSVVVRAVDYEKGDEAITHYRVLGRGGGLSLVECHLDTGRTHQIRVHMKHLGYPLIGDFLYHPENHTMDRQALHAGKLCFRQPVTGEELSFSVAFPQDMDRICQEFGLK